VLRGTPHGFLHALDALRSTTAEAVRDAMRRYLLEQPAVVISVVPSSERSAAAQGAHA